MEVSDIAKRIQLATGENFFDITAQEIFEGLIVELGDEPAVISGIRQPEIYDLLEAALKDIYHIYLDVPYKVIRERLLGRGGADYNIDAKLDMDKILGTENLRDKAHKVVDFS